jgi:hypothetical protein
MRIYKYYIGIDCGVKTGISIWSRVENKLVLVDSMRILEAMAYITGFVTQDKKEILVRIEDPRLRKWIPAMGSESRERGRNQGAGSIKRDAQIWEEFLVAENIPHEFVAPKNNRTKTKADYFKKITGWSSPTNEHGRDAAMLVFGY